MKILINVLTAKKISGGGFQIALNFMKSTLKYDFIEWCYFVSQDIDDVLHDYFIDQRGVTYFVFPTQPDFKSTYWTVRKSIKNIEAQLKPDLVYSITSPSYFKFMAPEVMRFANAWVTNPNSYAYKTLEVKSRLRNALYCWNQKRLLKKRRYFITQSETVKKGLVKITHTNPENIEVVANVLPAYYTENHNNAQVNLSNDNTIVHVACVAAPVPHKNINIIPEVLYILKEKYSIDNVRFLVTIPIDNPFLDAFNRKLKALDVEKGVHNYGYCTQGQLVELYSVCDLCFLPTLLETFSASLLEAMFFNLAVIASDFSFNKDVIGDAAVYFSPMNAESAAEKIAYLINNPDMKIQLKAEMPAYLNKYISYKDHVDATIAFLSKIIENR